MNSITIVKPGLFTSIQDKGRYGYRRYGIPLSGTLDTYAAGLANALLNKAVDTAVIEIILKGPDIRFNNDVYMAITGADISPALDGKKIKINMPHLIKKGELLSFGKINYGAIAYIAFSNNLVADNILGSKSYYKGITPLSRFHSAQTIFMEKNEMGFLMSSSRIKPHEEHFFGQKINVFEGPEYHFLNELNQNIISQNSFKISNEFSRMGYKLTGPPLLLEENGSMISSAVMPGTVQLTPGGQLIILMNDCQTTGGYPRILQLPQKSVNQIAQKKGGDVIQFEFISKQ